MLLARRRLYRTVPSAEGRKRLAELNTKHGRYSKATLEARLAALKQQESGVLA